MLGAGTADEGVLGVTIGAGDEDTVGVEATGDNGAGVTTGAGDKDTVGVAATGDDGAGAIAGAGVTDALGEDSVNVTFLATAYTGSEK